MERLKKWLFNLCVGLSDGLKSSALFLISVYRAVFSGLIWSAFGGVCRFEPSCSAYAQQAYQEHSFARATWLTTRRLCKCHPLGPFGYDPVPERKSV